jgi:hypothetical protein
LFSEACRPDTNLMRASFADNVKTYAPGVRDVNDKDALLELLRTRWMKPPSKCAAPAMN